MAATANAAYPWRDSTRTNNDEGETAGPEASISFGRSSTRRSDVEIKEEYSKLKDAGMPLDSMKLVLNEDLSAVRTE